MPNTIQEGNFQNDTPVKVKESYSHFPLVRKSFVTSRFGEYTPFYYMESVPKDSIRQRNEVITRSLNLKAPLMEDITMHRDYFSVDMAALLPNNWDKIYVNPKKGDDVLAEEVSDTIVNFDGKVVSAFNALWDQTLALFDTSDGSFDSGDALNALVKTLVFGEYFFSEGSLLSYLGIHLAEAGAWRSSSGLPTESYDKVFDDFMRELIGHVLVDVSNSHSFRIDTASDLRYMLSLVRDGESVDLSFVDGDSDEAISNIESRLSGYGTGAARYIPYRDSDASEVDVSLTRVAAYQICCSHFYSNDNVDYIYTAELWRQLIGSYVSELLNISEGFRNLTFSYNGVDTYYDWLSSKYFNLIISAIANNASDFFTYIYSAYFSALFSFKRSLRYEDYFVGAKTRPLAVGDVNVDVTNNKVSVVDVTKNIVWQRLLNNVNRLPSKIESYISGLFGGVKPPFDYHNPAYLGSTKDVIYASETENTTSSNQSNAQTTISNLRGNSSNFEFEFNSDRPCIYIGIQYYDIPRAYYTGVDRLAQHIDRFDMFLPETQYIGDQDVRLSEMSVMLPKFGTRYIFGYHTRNAEYKQVVHQAAGGFVENLPGFGFLFDTAFWLDKHGADNLHISPSFIRSLPIELDNYFVSLTGFSNGSYFHFIHKYVNNTDAKRPMIVAPQVL